MNQTEQMRKIINQSRTNFETQFGKSVFADWVYKDLLELLCSEQALAAEKPTLVRLTDEEIKALPFTVSCTHIYYNEAIPDRDSCVEWANAIMDAMIAKNGGKV